MLTVEVDCSTFALRIRSKRREEVGDRGANMTDLFEGLGSIGEIGDVAAEESIRSVRQESY